MSATNARLEVFQLACHVPGILAGVGRCVQRGGTLGVRAVTGGTDVVQRFASNGVTSCQCDGSDTDSDKQH